MGCRVMHKYLQMISSHLLKIGEDYDYLSRLEVALRWYADLQDSITQIQKDLLNVK